MELYKELYELYMDEFNALIPKENKFYSVLANPGSGKTYNLIKTLENIYGAYVTKNDMQVYIKDDNTEMYIPAGKGNLADEDFETFKLKTKNGNDVFFVNSDKKTLLVAYNTDIKKEFEKKVKNSAVLKMNADKVNVRTSHSLLFKLAEKLNMFPKKNEEGFYVDENKKVNFAKGSFTLYDIRKVLNVMSEKYTFLINLNKREKIKLSKVLLEIVNAYYQSDLIINKIPDDIYKLFQLAQKSLSEIEDDISNYLNSFNKSEEEYYFNVKFFISVTQHMKKLINKGEVELCHDYYYKEVFVECIRNKNRLFELFSFENNPQDYFNLILVDEAQDLTPIMTRLLIEYYKFAKEKRLNVVFTIVGDRKQAIYAFANRVDAFEIIERELGKDKVKYFTLNKSYRMSPSVCNFTNNVCKQLGIYKEEEKIIPAYEEKHGIVYDDYISVEKICRYAIEENEDTLILGRTNAEILVKYIEVYDYIERHNPNFLKYLKIDSKLKKAFKNLLNNGLQALEDNNLVDKLKILTGKENFTIEDLKTDEVYSKLPLYLQKFIDVKEKFSNEKIEKALNNRPSPKSIVKFMTLHSAKGLEAENVYILDGIMDALDLNKKNNKSFNRDIFKDIVSKKTTENIENKENLSKMEKFLYYVGITRAKRNLFLDKDLYISFKNCIQNVHHEKIKEKFESFFQEVKKIKKNNKLTK